MEVGIHCQVALFLVYSYNTNTFYHEKNIYSFNIVPIIEWL